MHRRRASGLRGTVREVVNSGGTKLLDDEENMSKAAGMTMTPRERFLFDLQGWLVVPNVLTPDRVAEINAALDTNLHRRQQDSSTAEESTTLVGQHRRRSFRGVLEWPKPWCEPFRELIVVEVLIPSDELLGRGWISITTLKSSNALPVLTAR